MSTSSKFSAQTNNLSLIRIYLSLSVVLFHCYELSLAPSLQFVNTWFNGEKAVQAFFIISGYLVLKSFDRSVSVKAFLIKRLLRIYPAYLFVILLSIVGGAMLSTYSPDNYFSSSQLFEYAVANLFFLNFIQPSLPGVFNDNLLSTINGSLWTLKIEVAFYMLVPFIAFFRKKMNGHLLYALLFIASLFFYYLMKELYLTSQKPIYLFLSRQLPGQLFYFIAGVWICALEKKPWFISLVKWIGLPCIIAVYFTLPPGADAFILAFAIYFFAFVIPSMHYPGKQHDISYGLYIYHFPIIQMLVSFHLFTPNAFKGMLIATVLTILLAILSWFFIERPFIIKKRRARYFYSN